MSLKRQLLVASLLMLLIPWAGLQFVLELDAALREQAVQQLHSQADRLARSAAGQVPATDSDSVLYAAPLQRTLNIDGYSDDWPGYDDTETAATPTAGSISWQQAVDDDALYLFLRVSVTNPRYYDPGQPEQPYEHLVLFWQDGDRRHQRLIRTPAPGPVVGWRPGRTPAPDYRITGFWQATGQGYQLELKLPRPADNGRFGFEVRRPAPVSTPGQAPDHKAVVAIAGPSLGAPTLPRLVTRLPGLERILERALLPGQQARVVAPDGWLLAHSTVPAPNNRPEFDTMSPLEIVEQISLNGLRALVRYFQPEPLIMPDTVTRMDRDRLTGEGIVRHGEGPVSLMVVTSLADGHRLVLEQSLEQLLALSGNTLGSVIARSTLLIIGLMLVLLGYASWLSWRITRLQRAVRASVDNDGRIVAAMPTTAARDELGELSRQFSQMVDNLQGYTRYLESFARRLSHELKTPVAVVRSSLENLSQDDRPEHQATYIQRAHQATDRLSQILQGMSEAARLEQSFDHAEKERFDLATVAAQAAEAYQALAPNHRIRYVGPPAGRLLTGSPELMVQLLDKLVDNARDFTPEQGAIEIDLASAPAGLVLSVFNEGSTLPDHLASEIFSPFVSLREGNDQGHLGQGLLIVRLIAEHHGGKVQAANHPVRQGVWFQIWLPTP
ncbi:ATP-binding protein [Marinobacter caseinilyticus]|uniref:ATP-binding protein n=1 Tax=Marinobacter caseinilyticus TaxID=2692195 RepID=UPI00140B9B69|nr:ATP-binding protein [Marinobacter caseinilyticus]